MSAASDTKTIIRRERKDRFTIVDNRPVEDDRLSYEALGLLTYLLSRPDNWEVRVDQLKGRGGIGKHKIRRIIGELTDAHYMKHERLRDPTTHAFVGARYTVFDEPQEEKSSTPVHVAAPTTRFEERGHVPDSRGTAQQEVGNRNAYKELSLTKDLDQPKDSREGALARAQKAALNLKPILDDDVEECLAALLKVWPPGAAGNVGKARGLLADMVPPDRKTAVDAAPRYLRALKDEKRKYVPAIETFLADGTWERFPEPRGSVAKEPEIELGPYVAELWAMLWRAVGEKKSEGVAYGLERIAKGLTTVTRAVPPADEVKALVAIKLDSPEYQVWSAWCQRLGFRMPRPDAVPVVFVPSIEPPVLKMVGYRPYQLVRPQRLEYRSKIWWWRLFQRIADGKPLVTFAGKHRVDPVEEVRRKIGADEVHFGPWPADSDLVDMIKIRTLTDEFEQWNTYFARLGSGLDLWPDDHIWAPGRFPPAVYSAPPADPVPDYDTLEGIGETR